MVACSLIVSTDLFARSHGLPTQGYGCTQNFAEAAEWFSLAANARLAEGMRVGHSELVTTNVIEVCSADVVCP